MADFKELMQLNNTELKNLIDAGDTDAMNALGKVYLFGRGNKDKINLKEALRWIKKSAGGGNSHAMRRLAKMHHIGHGVEQSLEKCFEWFMKAADNGNIQAMRDVGDLHLWGKKMNVKEYRRWYKMAKDAEKLEKNK